LREHGVQVRGLEQLLVRVERQAAQLALDQIGSVLRRRVRKPISAFVVLLTGLHQLLHEHSNFLERYQ
jgi:hypothetical protein